MQVVASPLGWNQANRKRKPQNLEFNTSQAKYLNSSGRSLCHPARQRWLWPAKRKSQPPETKTCAKTKCNIWNIWTWNTNRNNQSRQYNKRSSQTPMFSIETQWNMKNGDRKTNCCRGRSSSKSRWLWERGRSRSIKCSPPWRVIRNSRRKSSCWIDISKGPWISTMININGIWSKWSARWIRTNIRAR